MALGVTGYTAAFALAWLFDQPFGPMRSVLYSWRRPGSSRGFPAKAYNPLRKTPIAPLRPVLVAC